MFCPLLIYSKLGWKTCTFIPNKHHFRRWLISEITIFHQQFIRIKIDLICKTNFWTLPMRKITSKLRGIKVLRSKSHGNYERFFKIRWLYVFMEIPSRILLADIFARTIYWRSSMQNPNLFVMVWEYFLEWITSWDNIKYFRTSYDAKMWIKQTASYSYLKKKPIFSEKPFRWLYVHKSLCHL